MLVAYSFQFDIMFDIATSFVCMSQLGKSAPSVATEADPVRSWHIVLLQRVKTIPTLASASRLEPASCKPGLKPLYEPTQQRQCTRVHGHVDMRTGCIQSGRDGPRTGTDARAGAFALILMRMPVRNHKRRRSSSGSVFRRATSNRLFWRRVTLDPVLLPRKPSTRRSRAGCSHCACLRGRSIGGRRGEELCFRDYSAAPWLHRCDV